MGTKIPLPAVSRRENARGHPYPFQISAQTQQFLQASLFHATIIELAKSEFMTLPDAYQRLESKLIGHSFSKEAIAESWRYMDSYKDVLKGILHHGVLVSFNSHWDWYVRKLGDFVTFARNTVESPFLNRKQINRLKRIGFEPINEQLTILELASGVTFTLGEKDRGNLKEMTLVRNLGLHNRWEVDEAYLRLSACQDYTKDEIRFIDENELGEWHGSLIAALSETSIALGIKYVDAPDFP
jgi:hypothetical protein